MSWLGRLIRGAARGVRQELAAGQSGWVNITDQGPLPTSGKASNAGQTVSGETAMTVSAVWACTRRTAEMLATLPLHEFEKQRDGSRVRIEDDLSNILTGKPNSFQTAPEFWEGMVAHMALRGNGVAERSLVGSRLVGLVPIPNCVPKKRADGAIEYRFYDRGKLQILPAEKVFHLRGFGAGDGIGLSAISYGANSIGAALAAEESSSRIFQNAALPAAVLESDQHLTEDQRTELQTWLDGFVGSTKAGKTLMLERGLKWKQVQMNPEDAQLLDTRRFNVEDVCRWFGVPPVVIGHSSDGQTMWGSGVEQILLSWLTLGINPLLNKIEARILNDLVPANQRRRRYFEFTREAMMQMDSKALGDFLLKMRMGGFMSGDEGRDRMNLPRRGGQSDELFIQTSMEPVALIGRDRE